MEDFEVHPIGTGEVLERLRQEERQLRAEREALEVRCADLAQERDAWLKSYEHKQSEVAHWEKRYMALLESMSKAQALAPPVIFVGVDESTYLEGKA